MPFWTCEQLKVVAIEILHFIDVHLVVDAAESVKCGTGARLIRFKRQLGEVSLGRSPVIV